MEVRISGRIAWRSFHTSVGRVSSLGADDGGMFFIATDTSSGETGLNPVMSEEGRWRGEGGGGGNRCSLRDLALSANEVVPLMGEEDGGGLGNAYLTVFQRLVGFVDSTI